MKLALVTGAAGGLGSEICQVLAKKGHDIVAMDLVPAKKIRQKLTGIDANLEEVIGRVDFAKPASISTKLSSFLPNKNWTTLVNNAGISYGGKLYDATLEEWGKMMQVNLTAPFVLSQLFAQNSREFNLSGSIVNISSMVGIIGAKKPGYAASKAGLLGLTKSIAMQAGPKVRCNAIYPGAMETPMTADWDAETKKMIANKTPLDRIADPKEIAQVVAFLADEEQSSFMTGAVLNATGGQYLGQ